MCVYVCVCMYVCMYVYVCVCMYVYVCVCMCMCVYVCIYTVWVYSLTAKVVHFYFEVVKTICELTRFKSVLHELPVNSVKSRQMT